MGDTSQQVDKDRGETSGGRSRRGGVSAGMDRPKSRRLGDLAALWPYLRRRPLTVALAMVFLVGAAIATLTLPLVLGGVVEALGEENRGAINDAFRLLMVVAVVLAVLSACRFYFVSRFGERVAADIRGDVYGHLLTLSQRFFTELKTGEAISRLTADVTLIETFVGSSLSIALRTMLTVLGSLILLFVVNWQLALVLLLIIPAAAIPIAVLGRGVRKRSGTAQDRLADASSEAVETIENMDVVQAFGEEHRRKDRFLDAVDTAYRAALARVRARAMMTATVFIIVFGGTAMILWMGALAVVDGRMSGGELAQFITYAVFAASGMGMLGEVYGDAMRAAGAADRIGAILVREPEIRAPAIVTPLPEPPVGEVRFDEVSFSYLEGADPVLSEVSFSASPGEMIALVGASGAGKSTIFRLLLRLYDPDTGAIRLDGIDARDADPIAWRRAFGYVAQDAALFSGTILENIAFGAPNADKATLEAAAKAAQVSAFAALKDGLQTIVGPRGRKLSGGERQRLSLARALARNAPVLLLDEATSALDSRNEQLIQGALEDAMASRTSLVIAHRLSTIRNADRILVFDQGRIVETGTHEGLLARGGRYADLARLQFGGGDEVLAK